jgi:hypothetical protein
MPLSEDELVTELKCKLNVWYGVGVLWERVHWVIGVLGIACSAIASSVTADGNARVFAIVATVCLGILGFANPQKRSARYFQAYRLVDTAMREFRCGLIPVQQLLVEHRRAEELLNEADTHDPMPQPPAQPIAQGEAVADQ